MRVVVAIYGAAGAAHSTDMGARPRRRKAPFDDGRRGRSPFRRSGRLFPGGVITSVAPTR